MRLSIYALSVPIILFAAGCAKAFQTDKVVFVRSDSSSPDLICKPNHTRTCSTRNGAGTQTCNSTGSGWGTCASLKSCSSGYALDPAKSTCHRVFGQAEKVNSTELFSGFKSLHASEIANSHLFLDGWKTESDYLKRSDNRRGNRRLYQSFIQTGLWQDPQPLIFNNSGYEPGYIPGYHLNDPTVVYVEETGLYWMYFTAVPSDDSQSFADVSTDSGVGAAYSADGAQTWTVLHNFNDIQGSSSFSDSSYSRDSRHSGHASDSKPYMIIDQSNGSNETGARAPAAVIVGSEVLVYYQSRAECYSVECQDDIDGDLAANGPPKIFRVRLKNNGWEKIDTKQPTDWAGQPIRLTSIDVQVAHGLYWMIGRSSASTLALWISEDGLTFRPYNGTDGIVADDPAGNPIFSPRIHVTSERAFEVYFGYGNEGTQASNSVHKWSFQL